LNKIRFEYINRELQVFRRKIHATFRVFDDDEKSCSFTLTLSHEGAREKRTKEFGFPSPLMGDGEDEGESSE